MTPHVAPDRLGAEKATDGSFARPLEPISAAGYNAFMKTDAAQRQIPAAHLAREPRIRVMGVDYLHLQLGDGSDLYLTDYGRPFSRHLLPENHCGDRDWFAAHRVILPGTSALYKVTTKEVAGISKDIVLKWNRMGQDIPGETSTSDLAGAKFNSPFEEFALVIELRNARYESPGQVYTHKPLGIYVPRKYVEAERMGRKQYILDAVQRRHQEITLDLNRNYAVMYEWVKGIDAAEAFGERLIDRNTMRDLILRSNREMKDKGFAVRDSKAHHVIVRPAPGGRLATDGKGDILYALVDFELLERTRPREQATRAERRKTYLFKQAHRFEAEVDFPPGLTHVTIMGVDYVYGQVESTGGRLWVVGKDPALFEYFLPEKWRKTPRTRLLDSPQAFDTITKDNIHLVWRVSRAGRRPEVDCAVDDEEVACAHGYNSPFEEIALSMELTGSGIDTTYPRAIYMTGHKPQASDDVVDGSRFQSHQPVKTPDGHPILDKNHDHIIIWGYWNGPDEQLATRDEEIFKRIDALTAREQGRISPEGYARVMQAIRQRLADVGIEDLSLRGNHLLFSLERSDRLATDGRGMPTVRMCNFELLRRVGPAEPPDVTATA